ncbi:unnamed protein product [Prorocentrum cordatum]|uniref:Cyclic nucleotide-binding domain-containing protein n=1 Tax=Prorocentrum cordatum TaxID=2364126 RepID=A0ABN9SXC7_9DINO|nr:unnamed protein product [Polarella glacialis]
MVLLCALDLALKRTATVTVEATVFAQVLERGPLLEALGRFPEQLLAIRRLAASRIEEQCLAPRSVAGVELFRDAPAEFVDFVDSHTRHWTFFHDDAVLEEGAEGNHLIVLLGGRLQVEKDGKVLASLAQGSVLGELAALGFTERRSATARCIGPCQVSHHQRMMLGDGARVETVKSRSPW